MATRLAQAIDSLWPGFKYLGLAFWLAWSKLAYASHAWTFQDEAGSAVNAMYLISTICFALTLVIGGALHRGIEGALLKPSRLVAWSALASLGTVCVSAISFAGIDATALFVAGCALTGFGTASLVLKAGQLYGALKPRMALIYLSLSYALSALIGLAAESLAPTEKAIVFCLLPLCSCLAFQTGKPLRTHDKAREVGSIDKGAFARFLGVVFLLFMFSSILSGLGNAAPQTAELHLSNSALGLWTTLLAALALALVAIVAPQNIDYMKLYYSAVLASCAALVAFMYLRMQVGEAASIPLLSAANTFAIVVFNLFVWSLISNIAYKTESSGVKVFGWARGILSSGTVVGWLIGGSSLEPDILFAVVPCVAFVTLAYAVLVCNKDVFVRLSVPQLDIEERDSAGATNRSDDLEKRCRILGKSGELSERETEVLNLLARGYSSNRVAKTLGISINTARTHTRNIYTKLEIHAREDLMDALESK